MKFVGDDSYEAAMHFYQYFDLILSQLQVAEVDASKTLRRLLEFEYIIGKIGAKEIRLFVSTIIDTQDYNVVESLGNLCVFQGQPVKRLQNLICEELLKPRILKKFCHRAIVKNDQLVLQSSSSDYHVVEHVIDKTFTLENPNSAKGELSKSDDFTHSAPFEKTCKLFHSLLRLYEELCRGDNRGNIKSLVDEHNLISLEECLFALNHAEV